MATIENVEIISYPSRCSREASLFIYASPTDVPFPIQRVFVITAQEAAQRGAHAHKICNQLLVCLQGQCTVTVDDGCARQEVVLNKPNEGLLIPATLWAEQAYETGSILMVFADQLYEEDDYIRDHSQFLAWKRTSS